MFDRMSGEQLGDVEQGLMDMKEELELQAAKPSRSVLASINEILSAIDCEIAERCRREAESREFG